MERSAAFPRWFVVMIRAGVVTAEIWDGPGFIAWVVARVDPARIVSGVGTGVLGAVGLVSIRVRAESLGVIRTVWFLFARTVW